MSRIVRTSGPAKPVVLVGQEPGVDFNFNSAVTESGWATIIDAIRLDNDPTSVNSVFFNVAGYRELWVLLDIDSQLSPTDITFTPQYTDDGGNTAWDWLMGVWASMVFEDTLTASGLKQVFKLDVAGIDMLRMNVVATGTDATNYFDVTVRVRASK